MGVAKQLIKVINELLLNSGIQLSEAEQLELERLSNDSVSSDVALLRSLREFLTHRHDLAKCIGVSLVERGFQFLDEELDKYEEIKRHRNLTTEELEYGRSTLPSLVTSIVRLCSPKEQEQ